MLKKYIKFVLIIILVAIFLVVLLDVFLQNPQKKGFFVVQKGNNVLQIAGSLQSQGYINSRILFIWDSVVSGNYKKMKAGRYEIKEGSTAKDLIEEFTKFKSVSTSVLIVPGKTTNDIAQILSKDHLVARQDFLNLILNNDSTHENFYYSLSQKYSFLSDKPEAAGLEGYLFPDSYLVEPTASNQDIVNQILSNFDKKLTENLRKEIKKQNKKIFDIITMASILEKEVKTQEDKQIVAGILWKRAYNNLPLEVDSTLLYFLTSAHPSAIDKNVDSQYNTYKYAGLPIGPICNPSIDSITAAIYPKNSDYWFYLSSPDGKTIFAKTLGQHLINKAKYLTN